MENMMLLYEQGNGYYEKLRILQEIRGKRDYTMKFLLENEFSNKTYWRTACDLLYDFAPDFAIALCDNLGYKIEVVNALDGRFIHAYCISECDGKKVYIDVRGITTNTELFYGEFGYALSYKDGILYDINNNRLETKVFNNSVNYMDTLDQMSDFPWEASPLFEEHEHFYRLEKQEEM